MKRGAFIRIALCLASAVLVMLSGTSMSFSQETSKPVVSIPFAKIVQFGLVVRDVEKVAMRFSEVFGTSWKFYDFKPKGIILRGKDSGDGEGLLKVAIGDMGGRSFKLIQPISGQSLYLDFLKKYGEGFLYFSLGTEARHDSIVSSLTKAGVGIAMQGRLGEKTTFTILDTIEDLGCYIELIRPAWNDTESSMHLTGVYEPKTRAILDMANPLFSGGKRIVQVGLVVKDEKKIAKRYQELLGIGMTMSPPKKTNIFTNAFLDEKPVPQEGLLGLNLESAVGYLGDMQIELLAPGEGQGCQRRFLERRGNGIQHLSFGFQADYDQIVAALKGGGIHSEFSATLAGTLLINFFAMQDQMGGFQLEVIRIK